MRTREEEYLRRMKTLGYEPDLRGMDDDDIEWELSKMEEADRRREAQLQQQQPLRTIYRPVDPGLKARILRQFGQPYDESAIPKGQEFYLNGWDNGEDDEEGMVPAVPQGGPKRPNEQLNVFDTVLLKSQNSGKNFFTGPQPVEYLADKSDSGRGLLPPKYDRPLGIVGTGMNVYNGARDFSREVEAEALRQHPDNPELARKKGLEAAVLYGSYQAVLSGAGYAAGGGLGTLGVAAANTLGLNDKVKEEIKKQVMGKTDADYNKGFDEPLFPGTTPLSPG